MNYAFSLLVTLIVFFIGRTTFAQEAKEEQSTPVVLTQISGDVRLDNLNPAPDAYLASQGIKRTTHNYLILKKEISLAGGHGEVAISNNQIMNSLYNPVANRLDPGCQIFIKLNNRRKSDTTFALTSGNERRVQITDIRLVKTQYYGDEYFEIQVKDPSIYFVACNLGPNETRFGTVSDLRRAVGEYLDFATDEAQIKFLQ